MARLAALVPNPRVNLTRFHRVYAPNSKLRSQVTGRDKRKMAEKQLEAEDDRTEGERRTAMTWAQRLKRVFEIEVSVCQGCGGRVRVIASIEDPGVIHHILKHLTNRSSEVRQRELPLSRAPPQMELFVVA